MGFVAPPVVPHLSGPHLGSVPGGSGRPMADLWALDGTKLVPQPLAPWHAVDLGEAGE